jgi:hypothetical protein
MQTPRLTYGLELEWADVDRHATLPVGSWSTQDYTIVNSDGHANDPTGREWRYGGEINTEPSDSIEGQLSQVATLARLLRPTINYRCNLHVHVGFEVSLARAKRLLEHVAMWQDDVFRLVEPIPRPKAGEYATADEFKGAMRRYRRRLVSHQHKLPAARVAEAMAAGTLREFNDAHAAPGKDGRRLWPISPRPGMNTRSIIEHGTVEFRHFPGSADEAEIGDAIRWCREFVASAFAMTSPVAAFHAGRPWRFPAFRKYDHAMETRYQQTKYSK